MKINVTEKLLFQPLKMMEVEEMGPFTLYEDRETALRAGEYSLDLVPIDPRLTSAEILGQAREMLLPGARLAEESFRLAQANPEFFRELRSAAVREAEVLFLGTLLDDHDDQVVGCSIICRRTMHGWQAQNILPTFLGRPGGRCAEDANLEQMRPVKFYLAVLRPIVGA